MNAQFGDLIFLTWREVNAMDRIIAEFVARKVARALGILTPEIRFFLPDPKKLNLYGFYDPKDGRCYINARLSEDKIESTVAHEVRHAWHDKDRQWRQRGIEVRERDARIFEREIACALSNRHAGGGSNL